MSSCEIGNDLEHFSSDIGKLDDYLKQIGQIKDTIYSEITLITGSWEGAACDSFMVQFLQDMENLRLLSENISDFRDMMRNAKDEYSRCEENVMDVISSIRI